MRHWIQVGERIEEVVAAVPGGRLIANLDRGSVQVCSHDSNHVRVSIELRGLPGAGAEVEIEHDGRDVRIELALDGGLSSFLSLLSAKLDISIPRQYSLDIDTRGGSVRAKEIGGFVGIKTSGGGIEVSDVAEEARLETSGGRVEAIGIAGDLEVRTSGGSVQAVDVVGDLKARTSGGKIAVLGAESCVDAKTSGGPIEVEFAGEPEGRLKTSGGSIEIDYPDDLGIDLDAKTSGGKISIESTIEVRGQASRRRVVGQLDQGGQPLELRTSGGSIRIGTYRTRGEQRVAGDFATT
ncbi:MAG: DUF4097 domain-containing protein [bacterium]|nr:DUF4097 domain-containing protein [bacterium]